MDSGIRYTTELHNTVSYELSKAYYARFLRRILYFVVILIAYGVYISFVRSHYVAHSPYTAWLIVGAGVLSVIVLAVLNRLVHKMGDDLLRWRYYTARILTDKEVADIDSSPDGTIVELEMREEE